MQLKSLFGALKGLFALGLAGVVLAFAISSPALSQSSLSSGLNVQDILQQLNQGGQNNPGSSSGAPNQPIQSTTLKPNLPYPFPLQTSDIETYYSARAGADLKQFGYDSFGRPSTVNIRSMGALQDTYVVGVGDEINVDVRGQENRTYTSQVNRDGNIVLDGLAPIPAAGRRLADVRADIENRVKTAFIATQAFVSIGEVRQITVLVSGEVMAPGPVTLSALNSPVDALLLAGGIKKTGSLRHIRIVRGDKDLPVDLYAALSASDAKLQETLTDGDTIIVPPLDETVAVTGDVVRPGIFEIPPDASALSVGALLKLAGGYTHGGSPRLSMLRVQPNGSSVMTPITSQEVALHKGDILFVQPVNDFSRGRVVLEGQVRVPGMFAISRMPTLHALLGSADVFEEQPYMAFGVISRRDPSVVARRLIPFSPLEVIEGKSDLPLQDDDIIRIFSVPEVRELASQLRMEEDQRNPASIDLRSSQNVSGARNGASAQPTGTVGAALAGQPDTSGLGGMQTPGYPGSSGTVPQQQSTQTQNATQQNSVSIGGFQAPPGGAGYAIGSMPAQTSVYSQNGAPGTNPNAQTMAPSQSQLPPSVVQNLPQYSQGLPVLSGPQSGALAQSPYSQGQAGAYPPGYPFSYPYANPYSYPYSYPYPMAGQPSGQGNQPGAYNPATMPFSSANLVLDLGDPAVRHQLDDYRISLLGSVEVPGDYLAAPGAELSTLVAAAGGLTIDADLTAIEVTSTTFNAETGQAQTSRSDFTVNQTQMDRIALHPHDVVRFREEFSERDGGQVTVRGQVRFPGTFDILRGERLSSLLARAGGLTNIGYPMGAVFTRYSAARAEEDGYRRAADELERDFTVLAAGGGDNEITPQGVQFITQTIARLRQAPGVGRISIEADPVVLASHPDRDMILEPGDFLFIPRRPNSVSVTGEVLSAGSFLFKSGASGRHYVELAGGFAPSADKARTFILMPDGTARPLVTGSLLTFRQPQLIPGATIIVPRNLSPFRFRKIAVDMTQILSQLAVSAASIAVISRNN